MSKFIVGAGSDRFSQALYDAGVVRDRPEDTRRIIIDLKAGEPAMIYVELFAETETLDVLMEAGLSLVTSGDDA